jgi:hypothetical protein
LTNAVIPTTNAVIPTTNAVIPSEVEESAPVIPSWFAQEQATSILYPQFNERR